MSHQFAGLPTYECEGKLRNLTGSLVIYTDGASKNNGKRNNQGKSIGTSGCGVYGGNWLEESFRNPSMVSHALYMFDILFHEALHNGTFSLFYPYSQKSANNVVFETW